MNSSNPLEMSRQADEMPDLNLDFPNFDLFVATGDPNNAASNQMQMDSLSGPHSTHPSPMLNPIPDHTQGYTPAERVESAPKPDSSTTARIMGCPPPAPHVPVGYQGLITPVSSTELRPVVYDPNLVSSALGNHADLYRSLLSPAMTPLNGCGIHPSPFPQTHHGTPTDFLSPLTSPAIQPSPNPRLSFAQGTASAIPSPAQKSFPPLPSPSFGPSRSKRSATSDVEAVRKRASPLVKPTPPSKAATSAKRTPRTRPRGDSVIQPRASPLPSPHPSGTIEPVGDLPNSTPSPVDLSATFSMPPPAVPIARSSPGQEVDTIMEQPESADATPAASTNGSPSLAPVTPASLMNLGHNATQPTGLRHGPDGPQLGTSDLPSETASASRDATTSSKKDKTKEANHVFKVPKGKVAIPKAGTSVRQSPAILPMISPAIKSGLTAEAIAHLSTKSNYQNTLEGRAVALGINPSSSNSSYGPDGRKTSHKAAEQKRRDSLKAGFDDLRLLLPPITLSACAELDPGAAPPRGPPRNVPGGEDNPNRAVSKLALLRFSNEWIVKLGRRVERRDSAIEELKKEIQMLREQLGPNADLPPGCDLDANIDAIEEDNEENKSARMASRPTEKLKSQVAAIAEHDEEDGEEAD
ncbi:helix loop helix DNA-binding domain protein [Rhizoctonia solani]|uniref:Helix loop helix DNA-binding domain protein n=1 Tax=Rhizoctonia solani TaxID=456999 RepID=A0A8H8NS53_9AGAM|nr:helix loop helix DNA-binding domain protein [Rhizoctonia solani]QRW18919.1 helix loop helix DNA-binding domain protein [Rhizoctonia solani]